MKRDYNRNICILLTFLPIIVIICGFIWLFNEGGRKFDTCLIKKFL